MSRKNKTDKKEEEDKYKDVTVANMNVEGFAWHRDEHEQKRLTEYEKIGLTKKEKRAIIRAAFLNMLPTFLCALCGFAATMLLIYLWLT